MTTYQCDTVAALNAGSFGPGDIVQLKRGNVYAGPLTFSHSGTSGNPITITSYGSTSLPQPEITGNSTLYTDCLTITGAYVTVDHLLFQNTNRSGVYLSGNNNIVQWCEMTAVGEGVNCPASNALITKCYIHDLSMVKNTITPTNDDYGANGVVLGGSNIEVSYNIFLRNKAVSYDYGYDGGAIELFTSSGGTSSNILVHDNFIDSCDGVFEGGGPVGTGAVINGFHFYNNICINNQQAATIHNAGGSFGCAWTDCHIYNNTFVDENNVTSNDNAVAGVGTYVIMDGGASNQISGITIDHNIVAMNGGYYLYKQDEQTTHSNQCYWFYGLALATSGPGLHINNDYSNTLGVSEFIADPLFNNQSARDFTLQSGTPAAGMGGNAAIFNTTLNNALIAQIQGIPSMALPTVTVTAGSGTTLNALPPGGQAAMASSLPVAIASDQTAVPVSSSTLATAANQATQITSLQTIATNSPTVGQKTSSASTPVVIASDQSAISVVGSIAKFQSQFGPGSSTTYTTGQVMSAPIQATGMGRVPGGSGVITGAELALNITNLVEVDIVVMTSAPSGTYTAGTTWTNTAADRPKISQVLKVTDWSQLSSTDSVGEVLPSSKLYTCDDGTNTQSLWLIPIARGSITLASATDATLTLRVSRN